MEMLKACLVIVVILSLGIASFASSLFLSGSSRRYGSATKAADEERTFGPLKSTDHDTSHVR